MFRVDHHWDRLKTCVVGRAYPPERLVWIEDTKVRSSLEKIMIETEEDLQKLIQLLESFGVQIIRPSLPDVDNKTTKPMIAPRDHMAMIGDRFFIDRLRQPEQISGIVDVVRNAGNKVVFDKHINTADMIRMGKKLYWCNGLIRDQDTKDKSVFDKINHMINLKRRECINHSLKDYDNIFLDMFEGHVDSMISVIKPGLVLSINDRDCIDFCRQHLSDYEMIIVDTKEDLIARHEGVWNHKGVKWWVQGEEKNQKLAAFIDYYISDWVGLVEETYFGINTLMIDEDNAVCVNFDEQTLAAYSRHGVNPHPIDFRHRFFWDDGIHCITADIDRSK